MPRGEAFNGAPRAVATKRALMTVAVEVDHLKVAHALRQTRRWRHDEQDQAVTTDAKLSMTQLRDNRWRRAEQ